MRIEDTVPARGVLPEILTHGLGDATALQQWSAECFPFRPDDFRIGASLITASFTNVAQHRIEGGVRSYRFLLYFLI
jgi:hypothetical protein